MQEEKEKELQRAKNLAIKSLARRPFFTGELEEKLKKAGFCFDVIQIVIDFCVKIGALDDKGLISKVVEKELRRGRGKAFALAKCRRWVDVENESGGNLVTKEAEKEAVRKILEKKRIDFDSLDVKAKSKILRFLRGRGFDLSTIYEVLAFFE